MTTTLPPALQARHGRSWALDENQTAVERYRMTKPGRLFGQKEISAEEAVTRLEGHDVVNIERSLEVKFKEEQRLSRKEARKLQSSADLAAYLGLYGHEGAPRDVYRVQAQGKSGWVHPASYGQAAFLDGDTNFLSTEEEILTETIPSKLSYEKTGLVNFQYRRPAE